MLRPFAIIGFSFYAALSVAAFFAGVYVIIAGAALVAVILCGLFILPKNHRASCIGVAIAAFSATAYYVCYTHFIWNPVVEGLSGDKTVQAALLERSEPYEGWYNYRFKITEGSLAGTLFVFNTDYYIDGDYYDVYNITGTFSSTATGERLTLQNRFRSQGIFIKTDPYDIRRTGRSAKSAMYPFKKLSDYMNTNLDNNSILGRNATLKGMILGDRSSMDDAEYKIYSRTGVAHIFSVSGTHLALLSSMLMLILGYLRVPVKIRAALTILFVLAFMALTGFSVSVVRAGVLALSLYLGTLWGRKRDTLSALGIAVLIITLYCPYAVRSVSFLLSLWASVGIITIYPYLAKYYEYRFRYRGLFDMLIRGILFSTSAILLNIPVMIICFDIFPLTSPIVNGLTQTFISIALGMGFLAGIAGGIPVLGMVFQFIAESAVWAVFMICRFFSAIPLSYLPTDFGFAYVWAVLAVILAGVAFLCRDRITACKLTAMLSVIVLLSGMISYGLYNRSMVAIVFFNRQYGYDAVIEYGGSASIISVSGTPSNYDGYLSSRGIEEIELLYFDRLSNYTERQIVRTLRSYEVQHIALPDKDFRQQHTVEAMANAVKHDIASVGFVVAGDVAISAKSRDEYVEIAISRGGTSIFMGRHYIDEDGSIHAIIADKHGTLQKAELFGQNKNNQTAKITIDKNGNIYYN
ncbi:MAG: ComEC/Rec2 family competence protein [Oscillospiraceae bacterium]|nr:ComEC/Rec2 family competence protein [Oscillospiraceae bacterium]